MGMANLLRVVLFETPHDPYANLAYEEAIARLRGAGLIDDTLRIWRNENAVVIGYFQYADKEVRIEEAERIGAKIVRRFTGGGAVYHDLGNYNYAIAVKPERRPTDVVEYLYGWLIQGALRALELLGVKPRLENINDVVVGNRKVSGTAATIRWDSFFLHGSLLVDTDLSTLSRVLKVPAEKLKDKRISSVKYRVTRLSDILGEKIRPAEIIDAFVRGYEELLGAEAVFTQPERVELRVAGVLRKRYVTREWNFERRSLTAFREVEEEVRRIIEEER